MQQSQTNFEEYSDVLVAIALLGREVEKEKRREEEGRAKREKIEEKAADINDFLKPLRLLLDRHIIRHLVGFVFQDLQKHRRARPLSMQS